MDKVLERLRSEFTGEESRYAYADSATNAFLTAQIKSLREVRGLTQEELAGLVGTKQSGISRWQNMGYSSCKVGTLRKFARAFGVRLRITFEEFGSLPKDVRGFTKERLAPRKFEDDPAFHQVKQEVDQDSALRIRNAPLTYYATFGLSSSLGLDAEHGADTEPTFDALDYNDDASGARTSMIKVGSKKSNLLFMPETPIERKSAGIDYNNSNHTEERAIAK